MKIITWLLAVILGLPILFITLIYAASELGGEVVTLSRIEANGEVSQVRVWIVDEDDKAWIEHSGPDAFWISNLTAAPEIQLTRNGRNTSYIGVPDPNAHTLYHQLRRTKYGVADQIVGIMGPDIEDCDGIPVRLEASSSSD